VQPQPLRDLPSALARGPKFPEMPNGDGITHDSQHDLRVQISVKRVAIALASLAAVQEFDDLVIDVVDDAGQVPVGGTAR